MADLNDLQAAQTVKIIGSDSSGAETSPVRSDSNGSLHTSIVGNDGLYKAFVDSAGRVSVNANITTPEALYSLDNLKLNGTGSILMNANGSVTNQNFRYVPSSNIYYLESLSISIEDDGNANLTQFGVLPSLTNGLQLNIRSKGQVFTVTNMKDNAMVLARFDDTPFIERRTSGINTFTFIRGTLTFKNRIVLDPALGDYIELKVRDDLSGLTLLRSTFKVWRLLG